MCRGNLSRADMQHLPPPPPSREPGPSDSLTRLATETLEHVGSASHPEHAARLAMFLLKMHRLVDTSEHLLPPANRQS